MINSIHEVLHEDFEKCLFYVYYYFKGKRQNAPLIQKIINPQQIFKKLLHEVLHEVYTKSEVNFKTSRLIKNSTISVSTRKLI